jgi:hypothetical protein
MARNLALLKIAQKIENWDFKSVDELQLLLSEFIRKMDELGIIVLSIGEYGVKFPKIHPDYRFKVEIIEAAFNNMKIIIVDSAGNYYTNEWFSIRNVDGELTIDEFFKKITIN